MEEKHLFLMPDYYPVFKCKMGECRRACCCGWDVSLSLNDYFRLGAGECSKELRERIDRGVQISLTPTPEVYARIKHDYFGNCPMRLKDGRCAIHAELGEEALADVCRLYPRGIRCNGGYECSCSNSCEAVVELLFVRENPIEFIKMEYASIMPRVTPRQIDFGTQGREQEIRLWLIKILQDRRVPLAQRIMNVGLALAFVEESLETKDYTTLDVMLQAPIGGTKHHYEIGAEHLLYGIATMEKLLKLIDERSESVRAYGEKALAYFGDSDEPLERYQEGVKTFEKGFDKAEIWLEHLLINHLFFEQFPFQDRPLGLWEEFMGLSCVYSLLRFLCIGCAGELTSKDKLIDLVSAVFRFVDHSDFDMYSSSVLKKLKCDTPQKIFDLILL